MSNPFEIIERRLVKIESLLEELKTSPTEEVEPINCNVKEAAEHLKVSTQSVHNYIKKGLLPANKIGRAWLIKYSDIKVALKEGKSLKYKRG